MGVIPYLGTITAALVLLAGLAVYFFGVPAEMKEKAEEKVAEHMAESKAKEVLQGMRERESTRMSPMCLLTPISR